MFKEASLKLTAWYLAIIMLISFAFSLALFQVATREVGFGLRAPQVSLDSPSQQNSITFFQNLDQIRAQRVEESRDRILNDLFIFNFIILLAGGAISYKLARKTLEPIEEAHDSQVRFTADASHELRTPLSAMRSEIEVALRSSKISEKEARELLSSNLEEISRLTILSESLLKLARYQHGLPEDTLEKINTDELIDSAIKNISSKLKSKNIKMKKEIKAKEIYGDSSLLNELITIILDNAIKYSKENTQINMKVDKVGGDTIMTISDQGMGISVEDLPHVFERFYRADSSRSETQGYGLGLPIAAEIIKLHKGKIDIKSQMDKGTIISVSLPRAS